MTHDPTTGRRDQFEDEIRRALADEASEPAPEHLVARVAAIPATTRTGRGWGPALGRRLGTGRGAGIRLGLAGIAAVAIIVVGGSILLGGFTSRQGVGGPSASPVVGSPSAGAVVPSPAIATPSAVPSPSLAPSPSATRSPSIAPSPSAGPSVAAPSGGPVPEGFRPASVSFISAEVGWLLGTAPCPGKPCLDIVRTTDGGRTWASIPAPDTAFAVDGTVTSGVRDLRFADSLNGWAFGAGLWATHDGGSSWHRVSLPGLPKDGWVMALEAAAGAVHAVYDDGNTASRLTIATSPVNRDAWTTSPTTVEVGAGPVPQPQIVLHGSAGWLIEVDRAVVGGARLVDGAWKPWQPPCLNVAGPATLAASSASDLVAACDEGLWSTPTGVHLYVSTDGGTTFAPAAAKPPVFDVEGVAAPAPGTTFVGGSLSGVGSAIVGSFDGGTTWSAVHVLQGSASSGLTFPTDRVGVVISQTIGDQANPISELLMTRDGGRTWAKVPITGG